MAKLECYLSIMLISCSGIFTGLEAYPKQPHESNSTKIRLISTLFRHGDRTLDKEGGEMYPNDPHQNYNSYPYGDGQLTNVGKARAYQFGKILRKRYNNFLGDIYYLPNIYARSTMFSRTKMTLQLVLAALYPPAYIQKWNLHLNWQPVDINYTPILNDGLLFSFLCSKYQEKMSELKETPEVVKQIKQFEDLGEELTKYTGKNITEPIDFFLLYHTLATQQSLGLSLPEWTRDVFPNGRLYDAVIFYYKLISYKELNRLNGGQLLYRMIQDMNEVINGTLVDRKINFFSGHDINVAGLLNALGIYDDTVPQFSSGVIVELLEKNGNYFVKVLHYLGIPSQIVEVRIPGCNMLCPFDKFVKLRSATTANEEDPNCPITIPYSAPSLEDMA